MRKIICIIAVIICIVSVFAGCGKKSSAGKNDFVPTADVNAPKTKIGNEASAHNFVWEIIEADGYTIHSFIIYTNEETVGAALEKIGYASFNTDGKKTTTTLLGYNLEEGASWTFCIDGQKTKDSADQVSITDGSVYSFAYTK